MGLEHGVDLRHGGRRIEPGAEGVPYERDGHGHEQGRRDPFAGHVSQDKGPPPVAGDEKVVHVAAHFLGGIQKGRGPETAHFGSTVRGREDAHLDLACGGKLALHAFLAGGGLHQIADVGGKGPAQMGIGPGQLAQLVATFQRQPPAEEGFEPVKGIGGGKIHFGQLTGLAGQQFQGTQRPDEHEQGRQSHQQHDGQAHGQQAGQQTVGRFLYLVQGGRQGHIPAKGPDAAQQAEHIALCRRQDDLGHARLAGFCPGRVEAVRKKAVTTGDQDMPVTIQQSHEPAGIKGHLPEFFPRVLQQLRLGPDSHLFQIVQGDHGDQDLP